MKKIFLYSLLLSFTSSFVGQAQNRPMTEEDYYRIVTLPIPENIQLEVGGLSVLPDGRLAASTRRGEVWMITNPYLERVRATYLQTVCARFARTFGFALSPRRLLFAITAGGNYALGRFRWRRSCRCVRFIL